MTTFRVGNQCVKENHTERLAGSQWFATTNNLEDRHLTRIILIDRIATSGALSQETGSFARQKKVCMNSLTTFAVAWSVNFRLPTLNAILQTERLQWSVQR